MSVTDIIKQLFMATTESVSVITLEKSSVSF